MAMTDPWRRAAAALIQKQSDRLEAQRRQLERLQKQADEHERRLARLEQRVERLQSQRDAPQLWVYQPAFSSC